MQSHNSTRQGIRNSFDAEHLRKLRNEVPFPRLLDELQWPWKKRYDGVILFVCPKCCESLTSVNPNTNLARCFPCKMNWNPIDFLEYTTPMEFRQIVAYLDRLLPHQGEPIRSTK